MEHDEDTMRNADYIVDVGPGAGVHGGEIIAAGSVKDICKAKRSIDVYKRQAQSGKDERRRRWRLRYIVS